MLQDSDEKHVKGKDRRVWAEEHGGIIEDMDDIEAYPWPNPDLLDYALFTEGASLLRGGMKIIAVLGKIFTAAWQLVGFERFCELSALDPDFILELIQRIGSLQVDVFKRVIELESVGAAWIPDDIAFRSGTMLSPEWFIQMIFPYYHEMASMARSLDKPIIYHSDGDLTSMLDTIIRTGFHALHPIEPESMDIYQIREQVQSQLCLVGNISVNTLSVGTAEEIRALVKDRLTRLGYAGAYCVGSSNSVPNYVPFDNYLTLLEASAEHGRIDI